MEVRHGGSSVSAGRFWRGVAAWVGEEDEGWPSGSAAAGACCDLRRRDADRGCEDRRYWCADHPGLGVAVQRAGSRRSSGRQGAGPALLATFGLGAVAIWGFIEGRQELAKEAERERPVKTPQRISIEAGEPVITLDAATQAQSGLQTAILQQTQYHEQLHAFATVLDLQPLVDLDNNYALAKGQLKSAPNSGLKRRLSEMGYNP